MRIIQLLIILLLPLSAFADELFIDGSSSTSTETIEFQSQSSENVSPSDKARMYYDREDDKVKLSENAGAYTDILTTTDLQNLFETIAVTGQDSIVSDTTTDTLTMVGAGINVITTTAGSDTITFT